MNEEKIQMLVDTLGLSREVVLQLVGQNRRIAEAATALGTPVKTIDEETTEEEVVEEETTEEEVVEEEATEESTDDSASVGDEEMAAALAKAIAHTQATFAAKVAELEERVKSLEQQKEVKDAAVEVASKRLSPATIMSYIAEHRESLAQTSEEEDSKQIGGQPAEQNQPAGESIFDGMF